MNDFGWKDWKEPPYRGDGVSKEAKSRRRFMDRKGQRRSNILTVLIIFVIAGFIASSFLSTPTSYDKSTTATGGVVIILILAVALSAWIISANKFRKGYDIDISEKPKSKKRNKSTKKD